MTRDDLVRMIFNDNSEASCPSDCIIFHPEPEHYTCTDCAREQLALYEKNIISDVFTELKEYRLEMVQDIIMSDDVEYMHKHIMYRREKV